MSSQIIDRENQIFKSRRSITSPHLGEGGVRKTYRRMIWQERGKAIFIKTSLHKTTKLVVNLWLFLPLVSMDC